MHSALRFHHVLLVAAFGSASAYSGEGTTYGLTDPSGGNCNFMAYPKAAVSSFVAINKVQWDDSMSCGRCAQVTCTDPQCAGRSQESAIVYVVDQCPGCNDGDLDLSPNVFKAITGMEPSRVEISWEFVTCPTSGNIKYCLKEGSNAFWAAIQPTHTAVGVDSVTIDGKPTSMVASSFYFLLDGDSTEKSDLSNLKITMTSVSGETIEDILSFTDGNCVEGKSQFTKGESTSVSISTLSELDTEVSTEVPTETPTSTPTPTEAPTSTPLTEAQTTSTPTSIPTEAPTSDPTTEPPVTNTPTHIPTQTQTEEPTSAPMTESPATSAPTEAPSATPTSAPTTKPPATSVPAEDLAETLSSTSTTEPSTPTSIPTVAPTSAPTTKLPTTSVPTKTPSEAPISTRTTETPTIAPTEPPTTGAPTEKPTGAPTSAPPTTAMAIVPSEAPTEITTTVPQPTNSPTKAPIVSEVSTNAATETSTRSTVSPTSSPTNNLDAGTTASPTTSPSPDNVESAGTSVTNRSSDAGAGPTIVLSVLAVFGCLFIIVIAVMYIVAKKKKQLNAQMEQDKLPAHHDGSRYSAECDHHTNVLINEQTFPYTAAASPQPSCSASI
ncbi:hypothetical protein F444_21093 [Phytophthora nicotianae P1976]|uniref:Expansin-like EG45 domain-containing protein n=1 Tax=Phytophthora nicotianae P1976 TaxID=1317066 RepID=A0A080Z296_PHYNI|nr:hypothetical protein F444_21093 [Phytophthora nicotianae P1976]